MRIGQSRTMPSTTSGGMSHKAPGQQGKLVVAEATTATVALPKKAPGLAASQVAKGADPASVFAAQIAALATA